MMRMKVLMRRIVILINTMMMMMIIMTLLGSSLLKAGVKDIFVREFLNDEEGSDHD